MIVCQLPILIYQISTVSLEASSYLILLPTLTIDVLCLKITHEQCREQSNTQILLTAVVTYVFQNYTHVAFIEISL